MKLIPFSQCLDVNLYDKSKVNILALHETGHLIVMYAMDMMNYFSSITIQAGNHTNEVTGAPNQVSGLTDVTPELMERMLQFSKELAIIPDSGAALTKTVRKTRIEGAELYLPNICRLFGGGAICRHYGMPDEGLCEIDYSHIDLLLSGLGLPNQRETLLPLVDMYLNTVFLSLDLLAKAIYKNLVANGTLDKEQVMQIIAEWEDYKLFNLNQ